MSIIKRLSYLVVLTSLSFFIGEKFAPKYNFLASRQQPIIQKEIVVQKEEVIEENKGHQGIVIGHISGQYQHIYKSKKTALAD